MTDNRGPGFAMAAMYLQEGLRRALIELVQLKGDAGLAWLTDFREELLRDAKNVTGVDGVPIEDEAAIMRFAVNFLEFALDGIRREIDQKPKRN